jgi:hypothetical protein
VGKYLVNTSRHASLLFIVDIESHFALRRVRRVVVLVSHLVVLLSSRALVVRFPAMIALCDLRARRTTLPTTRGASVRVLPCLSVIVTGEQLLPLDCSSAYPKGARRLSLAVCELYYPTPHRGSAFPNPLSSSCVSISYFHHIT